MVPSQLLKQDALTTNTTHATQQTLQQWEHRQEAAASAATASTPPAHLSNRAMGPAGHVFSPRAQLTNRAQRCEVAADVVQLREGSQQETAVSAAIISAQHTNRGQQPVKAAADSGNAAYTDACMQGFLERVPASWLHLFIRSLSAASKQSLLASNKWLATKVLESSANIKLMLLDDECIAPEQTEMRRSVLTRLLTVRQQGFEVELFPAAWQPFPTQLASRVVSLTANDLDNSDALPAFTCCPWPAMTCLHTAVIIEDDINELCAAVEAGHLQQLRRLSLWYALRWQSDEDEADTRVPDVNRWVRALGPKLEELHITSEPPLQSVMQFTRLKGLWVHSCTLTDDVMQQLCEHPTLRHLTLTGCEVPNDHSYRHCRWGALELGGIHLHQLPNLPLASVPRIRLLNGAVHKPATDLQAFEACWTQHPHKITFTPFFTDSPKPWKTPKFSLKHPCAAMGALLKHMQGVETLELRCGNCLSVLPQLWQVLPQSVTCISLSYIQTDSSSEWVQLWQGMPKHVTRVTVRGFAMTVDELRTITTLAPAHVRVLEFCSFPLEWVEPLRAVVLKHLIVKWTTYEGGSLPTMNTDLLD